MLVYKSRDNGQDQQSFYRTGTGHGNKEQKYMYTDKKKNITKSTVSTLVEFESWVQRRVADQVEQNIKQSLMIGPKQGNIFFITVDTAATYKHYSRSMCSKRKIVDVIYIAASWNFPASGTLN